MRIRVTVPLLLLCLPLQLLCDLSPAVAQEPGNIVFSVDVPKVVMEGVPVSSVEIKARRPNGEVETTVEGEVHLTGIQQIVNGVETPLPRFVEGEIHLSSNLAQGRKILLSKQVDIAYRGITITRTIDAMPGWISLLPPLIAVVLSIALRNVLVSLFAGTWAGVTLLNGNDIVVGMQRTVDTLLISQLTDSSHLMIILFTLFLGAMVNVMSRSGGTSAFVHSFAAYTQSRERGQLLTWGMGLVVFFDDYANSLLVGSTMRPVTDRLRISREKLAFLVDATAAPVAGLALISTWVGVEIGYIGDTYKELGLDANVYSVFLATLPYRFYPWLMLVFVGVIAATGRDFGPMFQAERRALSTGDITREGSHVGVSESVCWAKPTHQFSCNALVPLGCLVGFVLFGISQVGTEGDTTSVLLLSSFLASAVAVLVVTATGALPLNRAIEAWVEGMNHMLLAVLILTLAWGIAATCNSENLNTAGYLVEISDNFISVRWMPTLAFLTSSAIAFATGSSWATMGLMMPLFISLSYSLLVPMGNVSPDDPILLGTIGGVLAGAIFGDHCSPISDTTVLSSAAAQCDHLDHVSTQMPYALFVGAISVIFGYIPIGHLDLILSGVSEELRASLGLVIPVLLGMMAVLIMWGTVRFLAVRPEPAELPIPTPATSDAVSP